MNIREVLENANITRDDKARRVLNTAPDKVADITLKEIESGVSIERLEALTIPVYQYGGQVTIHGIFKDIPDDLRVNGYKSIFLNGNGSLGVKYVAIDSDKKTLLHKISRYSKTKWVISINSEGCIAYRTFHSADNADDKARLLDCYNTTPDSLYVGNKRAVSLMYGGYAVILYIGAIYQDKLWELVNVLTGIESQLEYDNAVQAEAEAYAISNAKWEAERKAQAEADKALMATAMSNFKAPDNWEVFNGNITEVGIYAKLHKRYDDIIVLEVIQSAKRGGRLCVSSKEFADFQYIQWQPSGYKERKVHVNGWRITDKPVKAATVSVKADVKPQPDIVISHNDKLNGIEIKFATKPTDDILCKLKSFGFRWSYKSMLWYNRYTDNLWQSVTNEFKIGVC